MGVTRVIFADGPRELLSKALASPLYTANPRSVASVAILKVLSRVTWRLVFIYSTLLTCSASAGDRNRAIDLLRDAAALCNADLGATIDTAELLVSAGDHATAATLLVKAWNAAVESKDNPSKRAALVKIAKLQADLGEFERTTNDARRLQSSYERAMVLGEIAVGQARKGKTAEATHTLELMDPQEMGQRGSTILQISITLSERHDFTGAMAFLEMLKEPAGEQQRAESKPSHIAKANERDMAVTDTALVRASGLVVVAKDQAEAGKLKEALNVATQIKVQSLREAALRIVACAAADKGDNGLAERALSGMHDRSQKEAALLCNVAAMARLGQTSMASTIVNTLVGEREKSQGFLELAIAYAASGNLQQVERLVQCARAIAPLQTERANAFKRIAAAFAKSGRLDAAQAFAKGLSDPSTRSEVFQVAAASYWRAGKRDVAEQVFAKSRDAAASISDRFQRCSRLRSLAIVEAEIGDKKQAISTMRAAVAAGNDLEAGGGTDVLTHLELAAAQAAIDDATGSEKSFKLAQDCVSRYPDKQYQGELVEAIAEAKARVGDINEVMQSAREQQSMSMRLRMLLGAAKGLLERR